ncbi:MAG: hypothetical protein WCF65_09490 [Parachlamydiaceae bacterium]
MTKKQTESVLILEGRCGVKEYPSRILEVLSQHYRLQLDPAPAMTG